MKASVSPHNTRSAATTGTAVLGGRWRIDWHDPVRIGISPLSYPTLTRTREFVSGFYCSKAQANVIRCPLPVCIAENSLEQRRNFIEKAAALLTRQRGRKWIGECVEPPAHSGRQRRGGGWRMVSAKSGPRSADCDGCAAPRFVHLT